MSDKTSKYGALHDEDDEIYYSPIISGSQLNSMPGYQQLYNRSIRNPDDFWLDSTKDLYFERRTQNGLEYNFDVRKGKIFTRFMKGSTSNISYNCLERIIGQGIITLITTRISKCLCLFKEKAKRSHTNLKETSPEIAMK